MSKHGLQPDCCILFLVHLQATNTPPPGAKLIASSLANLADFATTISRIATCLFLQAFLGPKIRRQWTMAKDTRDSTSCQVLPFLLDISLALYDTLDLVKSSVDSEVVFQATLQVRSKQSMY